jgi:hypothetical protein
MDRSTFANACVDTTGVPAGDVARLVRQACHDWPGFRPSQQVSALAAASERQQICGEPLAGCGSADAQGNILLISGPTGVGKSTSGFQFYLQCLRAGLTAGYVDLDQIGFLRPAAADDPGNHLLKARNLAAIWRNYRAAGASHLVASGPIESEAVLQVYARQLPAATVTLCRLHAGPGELLRRILSRGSGGSWPQPGDPLRGQPAAYLRRVAGRAVDEDAELERNSVGAIRIGTDGMQAAEVADRITAASGWPATAAP